MALKNIGSCPTCQSKIGDDYAFCPVCGNKIGNRACSRCGNLLDQKDEFCGKCGMSIVGSNNTIRENSPSSKGFSIRSLSIFVAIIIFLGVSAIFWFTPHTVPHNDQPVASVSDSNNKNSGQEERVETSNSVGNTVENASSNSTNESSTNTTDQQIKELISNYLDSIVRSINEQNFSIVEGCLLPGSSIYSSQQDLVKRLSKQGISEKLNSSEVMQISEGYSPGEYKVKVYEDYEIYYKDGSVKPKSFVWLYTVVSNNGKYYLTNIEKSN